MDTKLLVLPGMEELGEKVLKSLKENFTDVQVEAKRVDFAEGTNKIQITSSIWASRVFILIDPYNYSAMYTMRGQSYPMCPDKHMMSLLRTISAIGNDAEIFVIMPMLYNGRQHARNSREDLLTAELLQLLEKNVKKIFTFDIHSDGLINATPRALNSFPTSKMFLKAYKNDNPDLKPSEMFALGTDEGALKRAKRMAKLIGKECNYGTCGKSRNEEESNGGTYKVERHELFGNPEVLKRKNVIITDDILATGTSLVHVLEMLEDKECKNVDIAVSFGGFTNGIKIFQEAKEKGLFRRLYVTNLTYLPPEIKSISWIRVVDGSELISDTIRAVTLNESLEQFF